MFKTLLAIALIMLTANANAERKDSLFCGSDIIKLGDTMEKIHQNCGEPDHVSYKDQQYVNTNRGHNGYYPIEKDNLEKWIYRWSGQFRIDLIFTNGRLSEIYEDRRDRQ